MGIDMEKMRPKLPDSQPPSARYRGPIEDDMNPGARYQATTNDEINVDVAGCQALSTSTTSSSTSQTAGPGQATSSVERLVDADIYMPQDRLDAYTHLRNMARENEIETVTITPEKQA